MVSSLSCNQPDDKNFIFCGAMFSVTTTQFCYCSMKAAIDNIQTNEGDYFPIKLDLQKQMVGPDLTKGHSL